MSQPYQELRIRARSLALASLFDKPDERDIICDLIQLGLELEKIIEIASEPMLAMIRMQWWVDLFDAETPLNEAPDFAKRLHHYPQPAKADLLEIVQLTQDSLQSPAPHVAWDAIFRHISKANGWHIEEAILNQIGENLGTLYQDEAGRQYRPLSDKDIKAASGRNYGFIRLANLAISRQSSGKADQDFLLIFRYLWCVIR